MHRNFPQNIVQFCDDPPPPKYPHDLHTPKIFIFLKTPKILKFKFLNPKNDPSLRMYGNIRVPPWDSHMPNMPHGRTSPGLPYYCLMLLSLTEKDDLISFFTYIAPENSPIYKDEA